MSAQPSQLLIDAQPCAGGDVPLDAACAGAMRLQLAGQTDLAAQLYGAILRQDPRHHAANYCFGMLQVQSQRPAEGIPHLLAALETKPEQQDYWLGLLEALLLAGRIAEAESTLALGREHGLAGASVEAFAKRLHEASAAAAERDERTLMSRVQSKDYAAALALARSLTERFPARGLGFKILGAFLPTENGYDAALAALETAARLMPRDVETQLNLGLTLAKANRPAEAERHLKSALKLEPRLAAAHCRLALVYEGQGRFADAEASLRRSIEMGHNPVAGDDEISRSHLLFLMSHNPSVGADALFAAHRRYGDYFEGPLRGSWPAHANSRDPERRLKIGLVSGDLCNHAIATFVEPVLARLKASEGLELHAYYTNPRQDEVSGRLLQNFRSWNIVGALDDAELAAVVMKDGIDVLIDLSGHTALNRLPMFARKPAPVQVTWMGYPGTTGLRAMDYFFADPHFLPPGEFDRHFTEKLVYLPTAPFQPQRSAPPVNALPALANGFVTFGSFNRLGKLNASTVDLWSKLLREIPGSRMLLAGLDPQVDRRPLLRRFADRGIAEERLTLHDRCGVLTYLALHHQVDLCLDTMPYNGGTTTIHGLWMGVPTLTVAGPTPASRQGAAILGQMQLHEFIARDSRDFIARGLHWNRHLEELADLRSRLRDRWQASADRKPEVIAGAIDQALRRMWRRWCAQLPPESFSTSAAGTIAG
jgi:predicted O-linked N-acetylglucosamine transferase (SPINDLY family)